MDDSPQFKHLSDFLSSISDDAPCGEDLDSKGDEEFMRIGRDIKKADGSREWQSLKKDTQKLLKVTKDLRLAFRYCRILLQTEKSGIEGLVKGLYLAREYIDNFWNCVHPPEDKEDPDEKYADRINAIADMGSWAFLVLPFRKKSTLLSFNGMNDYYLEDLVAFKNGDMVAEKQPPKDLIGALSAEELAQIDDALVLFTLALELAEDIKKLLLEKTEIAFLDFDSYLLPNLQEGMTLLADLSPNSESVKTIDSNTNGKGSTDASHANSSGAVGSIQSRSDVVKSLDMICQYYEVNEPSSPLPLLLTRAKSIVHKDFLEVLEELVPDSVSMTSAVFGRKDDE